MFGVGRANGSRQAYACLRGYGFGKSDRMRRSPMKDQRFVELPAHPSEVTDVLVADQANQGNHKVDLRP